MLETLGPSSLIALSFIPLAALWRISQSDRWRYPVTNDGQVMSPEGKLVSRGIGVIRRKDEERAAALGWHPYEADLGTRGLMLVQKDVML